MKNILIVEDDIHINQMLYELLTQNDYIVTQAFSGTEAILNLKTNTFGLILLDLMLPGKSGMEVLTELRGFSMVPVIALTAITSKESTISLLKAGADDYITKPFDNDELITRIEVLLRRNNAFITNNDKTRSLIQFKDIILNTEQYDAEINHHPVHLSKREYEILKLLMEHPKKVFTKNNIYESVWNDEFLGDDNTINVHISKIRSKLSSLSSNTEYIQTVWGIGFKMQE